MKASDKLLRDRARNIPHVMNVGKNGITAGTIKQLDKELDRTELVKVRFLRAALGEDGDRKALAADLAMKARARLVQVVGNVVVLHRPKKN